MSMAPNEDQAAGERVVDISSVRPSPGSGALGPVPLSADQKYCHACAAVLDARAVICPKCGIAQALRGSAAGLESGGRSRITAALFALLLGGFGIHKFYLGKTGQGILMLLFVWTFIPTIIAFIEGIIYLTMSDERFAAKYG